MYSINSNLKSILINFLHSGYKMEWTKTYFFMNNAFLGYRPILCSTNKASLKRDVNLEKEKKSELGDANWKLQDKLKTKTELYEILT